MLARAICWGMALLGLIGGALFFVLICLGAYLEGEE